MFIYCSSLILKLRGDDSTGGGISITVDPTWGETERVNF